MTFRRCLGCLLAVVVGLLAGWSGLVQPPAATAEPAEPPVANTYNRFDQSALVTDTASWRGPPATYDHARTHDADDRRLNGASARPSGAAPRAIYDYDDTTKLVQSDIVAATTKEPGEAHNGDISSLQRWQVAANNGDDLTRVGRWMSPDEHANMARTREVQVGGGGTTYVSHPPSIEVWRKQTDPGSLFVEFDVPRSVLRPGGQPGHAQIPSPSHPLYGRLAEKKGVPLQYPVPACNIVVVGSC